MKTEQEIDDRLSAMMRQRPDVSDSVQLAMLNAEIKRLQWVLGDGPDVILVPKPRPRKSQ